MAVFTEDVGHDLRVKLSKVGTEGMTEKELIALSIDEIGKIGDEVRRVSEKIDRVAEKIDHASIRLIIAVLGGMFTISASIVANLIFK
jgi:hypothetical protein